MKHLKLLVLALPLYLLIGCATIDRDANALIVNAERTQKIALVTFDAFLRYEYDNREVLKQLSPEIHRFAETLRANGKSWITSAHTLTMVYKADRSADNQLNLTRGLSILQAALAEAQRYIAASTIHPNP